MCSQLHSQARVVVYLLLLKLQILHLGLQLSNSPPPPACLLLCSLAFLSLCCQVPVLVLCRELSIPADIEASKSKHHVSGHIECLRKDRNTCSVEREKKAHMRGFED